MNNEIKENISVLNALQTKVSFGHLLNDTEKAIWWKNCQSIKNAGYKLKKRRVIGKGVEWYATVPRERHFTAELVKVNMRPNDGKPFCKGDCTTRAMAYCLQGVASYREIEEEQYRNAELKNRGRAGWNHVHRNTCGIWEITMLELGYVWVRLNKTIRRDNLAQMLSDIPHPIISESSGHVAVIDKGNVIDIWDSRHGRCKAILVDSNDVGIIGEILGNVAF